MLKAGIREGIVYFCASLREFCFSRFYECILEEGRAYKIRDGYHGDSNSFYFCAEFREGISDNHGKCKRYTGLIYEGHPAVTGHIRIVARNPIPQIDARTRTSKSHKQDYAG